jgi:hypothetical protein
MTEEIYQNTPYYNDSLLIDSRNIKSLYAKDAAIFIECYTSEKIKLFEYDYSYQAEEDALIYQGLLLNPLAAVFLIDANGLLKAYPVDSDEHRMITVLG